MSHKLEKVNGNWNAYVYIPDNIGSKKVSAKVFFPGLGQIGTNAAKLLEYGPNKFINTGWKPDFIVISAQPPSNGWIPAGEVDKVITDILAKYPIDPSKIDLTGLSAGGYAVTNYVFSNQKYADRVRSIIPLSAPEPDASVDTGLTYIKKANTGYYGICGDQDAAYGGSRGQLALYNKVKTTGVPNKFITVPGVGHSGSLWNKYYDPNQSDIYSWSEALSSGPVEPQPEVPKQVQITPDASGSVYTDISEYGAIPGDTLVLKGTYTSIALWNLKGTKEKPYIFLIDGVVEVKGNPAYLFNIKDSSYFKFTYKDTNSKLILNGDNGKTTGPGLSINKSNNFSIEKVEITGTSVGIMIKTDPSFTEYEGNGFSYENIDIINNYIHDINGEGTYIGYNGSGEVEVKDTSGNTKKVYAHRMKNVRILDNRFHRTGWDGLQITCGDNVLIQNNDIDVYGIKKIGWQDTGMLVAGNNVKIIANKVRNGNGTALSASLNGNSIVSDNEFGNISDRNVDGVYINGNQIYTYTKFTPTIDNNKFYNIGRNGLVITGTYVAPGFIADNTFEKVEGNIIEDSSKSTQTNNKRIDTPTEPEEPECPPCPECPKEIYPVAILMSDGSQLKIIK